MNFKRYAYVAFTFFIFSCTNAKRGEETTNCYPSNYKEKDFRNLQTLFFTPITTINGNDDVAFEPLYSEKGKPAEIEQFLNKARAKKVHTANILHPKLQKGIESSSANRMKPVPPPY